MSRRTKRKMTEVEIAAEVALAGQYVSKAAIYGRGPTMINGRCYYAQVSQDVAVIEQWIREVGYVEDGVEHVPLDIGRNLQPIPPAE